VDLDAEASGHVVGKHGGAEVDHDVALVFGQHKELGQHHAEFLADALALFVDDGKPVHIGIGGKTDVRLVEFDGFRELGEIVVERLGGMGKDARGRFIDGDQLAAELF